MAVSEAGAIRNAAFAACQDRTTNSTLERPQAEKNTSNSAQNINKPVESTISRNPSRSCLCGGNHRYARCWIINESIRLKELDEKC
ncbi:hypothetical protein PABG_11100 [Paracoccidioides brasiliensis Pb03]|nr:hypothetical protein PABG_11100 [Paracoccidioides brasiliensis Pb03]ODH51145.1 hypothetical protein GX48_02757 [Paracoccidioides brasiliensis]